MSTVKTRAWVMDVGAGRHVAAGTHHVVEYLLSPQTIGLPLAPAHIPAVLIWREQIIPSVDLARLAPSRKPARHEWHGAVVLAYQEMPGKPMRYGALLVYAAPEETWVSNDMACLLPEESAAFQYFTSACFANQERAVPVLDTTKLFSESLPAIPTPYSDEAQDALSLVETTPAKPAKSDTLARSEELPQVLEQEVFPTESAHQITEHEPGLAEETTSPEPWNDVGPVETDVSPDPVVPTAESPTDAVAEIPPPSEPAADVNHLEAVAEASPEEHRGLQQQQTQAESDTLEPSEEPQQVLEPAVFRTETLPQFTEQPSAPAEETTGPDPAEDSDPIETDPSPDPVTPAAESPADAGVQISPAADASHEVTIAEASPEESRAQRRQQAQQVIQDTLVAIYDEVALNRVLLAVLARDGRSVRANYYQGVAVESPLHRFCFELEDSSLFARLVERPQYVWLRAQNRDRLTPLLPAEVRESLGESEFFAASVFVGSKLVGVCYGDEYPFTDGLDEFRYQQFKDLCSSLARRLREMAT